MTRRTGFHVLITALIAGSLARCGGDDGEGPPGATAKQWSAPVLIQTSEENAEAPSVAVDSNGNGIAIWWQTAGQRFGGEPASIWANRFVPGSGWGTDTRIESEGTALNHLPQTSLVADTSGNFIAAWSQDQPWFGIVANRYVAATGKSPLHLIDKHLNEPLPPLFRADVVWNASRVVGQAAAVASTTLAGWRRATRLSGTGSRVELAVDGAGSAIAVWDSGGPRYLDAMANRYQADTGWGTTAILDRSRIVAVCPQVAADPSGNFYTVWQRASGDFTTDIYASRFRPATGWDPPTRIGSQSNCSAEIASDAAGNALAVWAQGEDLLALDEVRASRFTASEGWGPPVLLETDTSQVFGVHLAVNASGQGVAVWQTIERNGTLWTNHYDPTAGWGTASKLAVVGLGVVARLGIDPAGNATLIWGTVESADNGGAPFPASSILSCRYEHDRGWSEPTEVDARREDRPGLEAISLAVDRNGNALAVWSQLDKGRFRIFASRYE